MSENRSISSNSNRIEAFKRKRKLVVDEDFARDLVHAPFASDENDDAAVEKGSPPAEDQMHFNKTKRVHSVNKCNVSRNNEQSSQASCTTSERQSSLNYNSETTVIHGPNTDKDVCCESSSYEPRGKSLNAFLAAKEVLTNGTFTNVTFDMISNYLSKNTVKSLAELSYTHLTEIQYYSLPSLMCGKSAILASKTGSGKTLAYLIPVIELLDELRFKHQFGTGAIIIAPTRELCLQIHDLLKKVLAHHQKSCFLLIGGARRKQEVWKLSKGVTFVIATPGRLLDHLKNTKAFLYSSITSLVIDEADRLLERGFEDQMLNILEFLKPVKTFVQVILTTATLSDRVKNFAEENIDGDFETFDVSPEEKSTVTTLQQAYVVIPTPQRFICLCCYLKRNIGKKIMVFFNSCRSVFFYKKILSYVFDVYTMAITGKMDQKERTKIFFGFCKADNAILLCTDVAARGLDIPYVDCILQYDPPFSPKEYIHRVGRTARAGSFGEALLFLRPEEMKLLEVLAESSVPIVEHHTKIDYDDDMQKKFEAVIEENKFLKKLALKAYVSFVRAYTSHNLKHVYDITNLNFAQVAKSFGFACRPKVHFGVKNLRRQPNNKTVSVKPVKLKIDKLKPAVHVFSHSDSKSE